VTTYLQFIIIVIIIIPILSWLDPVHTLKSHFLKILLNIILPLEFAFTNKPKEQQFDSRQGQRYTRLQTVHIGTEAHPNLLSSGFLNLKTATETLLDIKN